MKRVELDRTHSKAGLLTTAAALTMAAGFAGAAQAAAPPPSTAASGPGDVIQEVVVTAQRRAQNVQDVPVAVTALTQESIVANRVVSVNDLSMLAPGFSVVPSAGGTQIPSFTVRGRTSYGVVPGSDKPISVYLDGVYISSARGSIFDLPDISQIEMLRGPQGTLFGRNATAGAVSITTRNPTGNFGVQQDFTVGNYDQFRSRTTIDTPTWGPFSAYVSYVHNQRRGDTRNLGAGTVWDYSNVTDPRIPKRQVSPSYLGSDDSDAVFVAVKFQPTDRFTTVYKYDYSHDVSTPEPVAFLAGAPATVGGLAYAYGINFPASAGTQRPSAVNNAFSTPRFQENSGHSLTSTYQGDNFTIRNIAALRDTFLYTTDQLDGLGGLVTGPSGAYSGLVGVGVPYLLFGITNETRSRQWSDELQGVYRSRYLTLTVGALAFQSKDQNGAYPGVANNVSGLLYGNKIPPSESVFYNEATSVAAYAQAEVHVTSNIDIVGGVRETEDWKNGTALLTPDPAVVYPGSGYKPYFTYNSIKPSYLIGVNYKPTKDILLYVKYSTAFVSGGEVALVPFQPETVESWEGGIKAEFFDHRLRTNLAVYDATYQHLQDSEGGGTFTGAGLLAKYPWIPLTGTFIIDQGGQDVSKGVEFEGTWLVTHGVTVGANISYTDTKYENPDPAVDNPTGVPPIPTLLPKWTVGLWGHYEKTFANDLKGSVYVDANWRDSEFMQNPLALAVDPEYAPYISVPATWVVNARATLAGFKLRGVNAEVSLWAKNLTDDRSINYALLIPGVIGSATYQPARTFGLDINFKY